MRTRYIEQERQKETPENLKNGRNISGDVLFQPDHDFNSLVLG